MQRGSYEVYVAELEASDADSCHQRNIHNRSLSDIQQAAAGWQETPSMYPLLDLQALLGGRAKAADQVCQLTPFIFFTILQLYV